MDILIKPAVEADLEACAALVRKSFDRFVAPGYSPEGRETFYRFIRVEELRSLLGRGFSILCAWQEEALAGVLAVREVSHISLFFVDPRYMHRGVGRRLMASLLEELRSRKPLVTEVTVHSSPYAREIYRQLGFRAVGEPLEQNGIRFVPMKLDLL